MLDGCLFICAINLYYCKINLVNNGGNHEN